MPIAAMLAFNALYAAQCPGYPPSLSLGQIERPQSDELNPVTLGVISTSPLARDRPRPKKSSRGMITVGCIGCISLPRGDGGTLWLMAITVQQIPGVKVKIGNLARGAVVSCKDLSPEGSHPAVLQPERQLNANRRSTLYSCSEMIAD